MTWREEGIEAAAVEEGGERKRGGLERERERERERGM